jgi:hypothetical protein
VDFLASAPVTGNRLSEVSKAELLAWWVEEASREGVAHRARHRREDDTVGPIRTPVIDIRIRGTDRAESSLSWTS